MRLKRLGKQIDDINSAFKADRTSSIGKLFKILTIFVLQTDWCIVVVNMNKICEWMKCPEVFLVGHRG